VGLARNVDAFSAMPWSTPQLMTATRRRLAELAVDAYELPTLFDVDTAEDLARYRNDSRAAFSA
jgi:glycosyltransferase A (GT-A) superfamily protein (DUF2064 family)